MSATAWLNRPGLFGRLWRPAYEVGYQAFKCVVSLILSPIWGIRRIGRAPKLPPGGVVLCPNHTSYLDPAFVQLVLPRRVVFVMTERFYESPKARWFYRLVTAIPIGKGGRSARKGIRRAMALVKRGHAIVIFPEGRLSTDGQLNPAQRGIGTLARRTGVPVIPVAITGALQAWPKGARRPGRSHVRVAFGEPLAYDEPEPAGRKAAEQAFADRVLRHIAARKGILQAQTPRPRGMAIRPEPLQQDGASGR